VSGKRKAAIAALVLLLLLAVDFSRPPSAQVSARVLIGTIDVYQATFSILNRKAGVRCRFKPTCSHYAEGAIRKYGALKGTGKAIWRVLRCGPWTPAGTVELP
jgi:putative membrane protein insertion efficiency factor